MKHLDLFSGIGGFALAARWVWPQRHHWPEAPIHDEIRTFDARQHHAEVDVLTGGFPCQPFSSAGQRRGTEDDRHLWPEMLRCIRESRPRWVLAENVYGIATWEKGLALESVLSDLEGQGYETLPPAILPACGAGAPLCRVDDGVPDRVDRIGALGGAVVPELICRLYEAMIAAGPRFAVRNSPARFVCYR